MRQTGKAYFVHLPDRIEELQRPHLAEKEHPYEVAALVELPRMDYENFITDMVADRQFIEDHASDCAMGEVFRCLLVRQRGKKDGVLVLPWDRCYVRYAAYYAG